MEPPRDDNTEPGFEFGPMSESEIAGISDLITGMSHSEDDLRLRDKSPAYYRWMYLENPGGPAIVHSARHDGRIVASFAIAPKVVQLGGKRITLGKTMDMFTDPDYQGRGLIKRCTDAVFTQARQSGMDGWYVTPSVNSYPIFTGKWGYREDFEVIYKARVLKYAPVLAAAIRPAGLARVAGSVLDLARKVLTRRKPKLPAGYELHSMETFGGETDQLWAEVAAGYTVALVRDAAYMNWRYVRNPDDYTVLGLRHDGRLVGIIVLTETIRRGVAVGEIVDYVCAIDDEGTFRQLVRAAVAHFEETGAALIESWSIPGTRLDARLRRAGLSLRRTTVKFLISPGYPDPIIYDPDAWLLTQGDGNDV